jgi:polyisoprenoid-binding protein YceI
MSKHIFLLKAIVLVALFALAGCSALPVQQSGASSLPAASTQQTDTAQPVGSPTVMAPGASPTPETILATLTTAPSVNPTATTAGVAATSTPASGSTATQSPSLPAGEILFNLVADKSSADYRVREQLARLALPSDAVGKTSQISGSVVVKPDGTIDSSLSKFTVDLSTLASDSGMRDGFVGRSILQTGQYPTAVFVPTKVTGLAWPLPQSGQLSFKVTGDLTVKDVTKPVTWDVTGSIKNGVASGTAATTFTFEDFNLNQPSVPVVLSIQDHITLEVTLALQQASQ